MNTDLVKSIAQRMTLSPQVRAAFLSIDRGWFVPYYYIHEGKEWVLKKAHEVVYQDQALVTHVVHGVSTSSSSMPSVMATMLEALELQPGQRVLEIGAGTGYNAALMACVVGETGRVVSIDVDALCVQEAVEHLTLVDHIAVDVYEADGHGGYPFNAPYDRIIATAGFRQIPITWEEQLATGGIFVGNLLGNLASVLIRLVKGDDGHLHGTLLPDGAFFMELRGEHAVMAPRIIDWTPYDAQVVKEESMSFDVSTILDDQAFLFFLQCSFPMLERHMRYNGGPPQDRASFEFWLVNPETFSSIVAMPPLDPGIWVIQERGQLWSEVSVAYQHWLLQHSSTTAFQIDTMTNGYHVSFGQMAWNLFYEIVEEAD